MLLVLLLFGIPSAVLCAVIAESKRRSVFGWALLGFLFWLTALLFIVCLPVIKEQNDPNSPPRHDVFRADPARLDWSRW